MPQASTELQQKMISRFGDIGDGGPIAYLEAKGYILLGDWLWLPLYIDRDPNILEWDCIDFLVDEWDFGGVILD